MFDLCEKEDEKVMSYVGERRKKKNWHLCLALD